MASQIYYGKAVENSPVVICSRARALDGSLFQQADIASIAAYSYDTTTGSLAHSWTPSVPATVYNSLQTDARWTKDDDGFNFAVVVPPDALPEGDRRYRIEIKVTPTDGTPFALDIVELETFNLFSE